MKTAIKKPEQKERIDYHQNDPDETVYAVVWKSEASHDKSFHIIPITAKCHFEKSLFMWHGDTTEDIGIFPSCYKTMFLKEQRCKDCKNPAFKGGRYFIAGTKEDAEKKIETIKQRRVKLHEQKLKEWKAASVVIEDKREATAKAVISDKNE